MWDLPGPGVELVPPALAGRFLTTAPQGNPLLASSFGLLGECENRDGKLLLKTLILLHSVPLTITLSNTPNLLLIIGTLVRENLH